LIHPIARGQEQRIVEYVNSKVQTLKTNRQLLELKWLHCMEAYGSKFDEAWAERARQDNRSARYLSLTWDAVENITAQMMAMLFPNERWFTVEPGRRGGFVMSDDLDAPKIEHLLRYQHDQMMFVGEIRKLIKWLVITGNCPWSMTWCKESAVDYPAYSAAMQAWLMRQAQAQAQMNQAHEMWSQQADAAQAQGLPPPPPPMAPPMEMQPAAASNVMYEGPRLIIGDPFNFVIDDRANDEETAFRAVQTWRSKAYLEHLAQVDETGYAVYENLDQIRDAGQYKDDYFSRNPALAAAFGMQLPDDASVSLIEAAGDFELPLQDELEGDQFIRCWVAVVANNRTLLKFEPTHLWSRRPHIQLAKLIEVPGQVYGGGLVENTLGLTDATNVRFNQILDAAAVAINPETKVFDDGVYDPETAESGPGAQHIVGDINNLQPLLKNLQGLSLAFTEIGLLMSLVQQMFRSPNAGAAVRGDTSATRTARDTSVMGGSLQDMARYVEEHALVPILEMQLQHSQQYLDEEIVIKIVQENMASWATVGPDHVQRRWLTRVRGSANTMLKEKRLQDLLTFFQLVSGNPLFVQTGQVDVTYLAKRIYEEMGFMDGDKVFPAVMPGMMGLPGGGVFGGGLPALGGGPGTAGDQGYPGVGLPAAAPPAVAQLSPFTSAAVDGLMGGRARV